MDEIAKIALDNEMDLVMVHKRSMKLAEMAELTLAAQTSFATSVSEVARTAIESEKGSQLVLSVDSSKKDTYIVARVIDQEFDNKSKKGLEYAKRLIDKYNITTTDGITTIELFYAAPVLTKFTVQKLDEWRSIFRNEPPVSPYEEIKQKNEQLLELSEQLRKSEAQYKTVTNSLPLIIFTLSTKGELLYANEGLSRYTGETLENLNNQKWKNVVHEDDYDAFSAMIANDTATITPSLRAQARLRHKDKTDYLWHQALIIPFNNGNGKLQYWVGYLADIHAQKIYEETLKDNRELKDAQKQLQANQQTLENYIEELNRSNQELQQFAFVASHDLQEPVRKLLFYSDYLLSQYNTDLNDRGMDYLRNMQSSAQRMRNLIQDLLLFSQINVKHANFTSVNLNTIAKEALQDLEIVIEEKEAKVSFDDLPVITGDAGMMRQLFVNLLSNSLKYSDAQRKPVVSVECTEKNGFNEIVFADNGIGFDEQYLTQMFTLFQRLHSRQHYEGTGLGLAICLKIVETHNGKIWAEGREGVGARFYVSLPVK